MSISEKDQVEIWEAELRKAGWARYRMGIWKAPNGALFLGPYQAWRMMKSVEQWGGEPLGQKVNIPLGDPT